MEALSASIEYTNVKRDAKIADIRSLCKQAMIHQYRAVCTNSCYTRICKEEFKSNKDTIIVATAGFPYGTSSTKAKIYEAIIAAETGAREIDFVINIGALKERKDKEVKDEITSVVRNCKGIAEVKIIIEAPLLTEEEIIRVCNMAKEADAAYIKTGTGTEGPVTVDTVKLIRKTVGKDMKIKAAGGVRDIETVKALIRAGADTIGTSKIIKFED